MPRIYDTGNTTATNSEATIVSMYPSKTPGQIKQKCFHLSSKRMATAVLLLQQVLLK